MEKNTFTHDRLAKLDVEHQEYIHDHDITGTKDLAAADVMHYAKLSEEELAVQRKLVRKIDLRIMRMFLQALPRSIQ